MRMTTRPVLKDDIDAPSLDTIVALVEDHMVAQLEPLDGATRRLIQELGLQNNAHAAALYHLSTGGHRIRARLCIHACLALGVPLHTTIALAAASELVHNASLIHDDIQDQDDLRRDHPTVWAKYGSNIGICAGDLVLSAAYLCLAHLNLPDRMGALIQHIHARIAQVIHGQSADLLLKDQALPSLDVYERIVVAKSGALLSLPLELSLIAAGQDSWIPAVQDATTPFAIGYQVLDDLNDVQSDKGHPLKQRALNAVQVLEASGEGADALATAKHMAKTNFAHAAHRALQLPQDMGRLLHDLACLMDQQIV